MGYLLKNTLHGPIGVPGIGSMQAGEEREVDDATAARYSYNPEFSVRYIGDYPNIRQLETGLPAHLGFYGAVSSTFGYGSAAIDILHSLARLGVEVRIAPEYEGIVPRGELPQSIRDAFKRRSWLPKWELCHCLPDALPYARAPYKVAWTMWETDRIPDGTSKKVHFGDWARLINEHSQQLVVPCQHNKELFEECGVTIPVTVIPYGLHTGPWPHFDRAERSTFTVVVFGDLTERKAPMESLIAFQKAFPRERDVRLILKTQFGHLGNYGVMPVINDPRVTVINETWDRAQLLELMERADCMLWLSKGEGFGLPPLQAALTGLPVVMTTHTGMAEYFSEGYFYGVGTVGKSQAPLYGKWYEPDTDDAAAQLRHIYENRAEARAAAVRTAAYVREEFSIERFASRIGSFLTGLD